VFSYVRIIQKVKQTRRRAFSHSSVRGHTLWRQRIQQEDQLTLFVGIVFLAYIFCNLPANIILLVDPTATKFTKVICMFSVLVFTTMFQAHLPCYTLAWLSSVIKPFVYVGCSPAYRQAFVAAFNQIFSTQGSRQSTMIVPTENFGSSKAYSDIP